MATSIRAWGSGSLAAVGGILMVASGFATRGLLLVALGVVEGEIPHYIGGIAGLTATLAVSILILLITLGGITVVLGGLALLLKRRTTGRLLILLGGGAGFLGLLITFGLTTFRLGLDQSLVYAPYWVGLIMATVARRIAKGI